MLGELSELANTYVTYINLCTVLISVCFCSIYTVSTESRAMVFSDYTKQRILSLHWQGHKVSAIVEHLVLEDGIRVSKVGVQRFIKCYNTQGTIARQPGQDSHQKSPLKSRLLLS